MPVKISEWKNNVGTQKLHMTLSRLKTGSEGINKYNIWLRSVEQKKKNVWISPLKLLKFCMNISLLHSFARLQKPKLWILSQKSCLLLRRSSYMLTSAKDGDVYPTARNLQEFCAAVFCFGD